MTEIRNRNCNLHNRNRMAFSLIELLVVIAVIVLLVGILIPSLAKIKEQGYRTKSLAAITTLSNGCLQYKNDTKYYPGQRYTGMLAGNSGDNTGSQVLAACLLEGINADDDLTDSSNYLSETDVSNYPTDGYITWNKDLLIWRNGETKYALSDYWKSDSEMPILYYPSRIGNNGAILTAYDDGAFRFGDNSGITGGNPATASDTLAFRTAIWDKRFGNSGNSTPVTTDERDKAYNSDSFLLFAAGVDRQYFTDDDLKNFDN